MKTKHLNEHLAVDPILPSIYALLDIWGRSGGIIISGFDWLTSGFEWVLVSLGAALLAAGLSARHLTDGPRREAETRAVKKRRTKGGGEKHKCKFVNTRTCAQVIHCMDANAVYTLWVIILVPTSALHSAIS